MRNILPPTGGSLLRTSVKGVALGCVIITALSVSAYADDRRDHRDNQGRHHAVDRDWREHEGHAHRYWNHPGFEPEPGIVYAPPVIYSPPPEYEAPGFNLIVPLHIH